MNTARPFQRTVVDAAKAAIGQRPLIVSPTGSGKSFIGSLLVAELNVPTWWVTHRKELVDQAAGELRDQGLAPGFIMAGRPYYPSRQIQVASVDTLRRRTTLPPPRLIVIDEAHHTPAGSFRAVVERAGADCWVAGLTATPYRLDGKGLGETFGTIIEAPREAELIELGFLVEPKAFAPPASALPGVSVTAAGDFNTRQLAKVIDKPKLVGDVVSTWRQHAAGYLTIVFACSVEHSLHLVEQFRKAGVAAEHVDADTPREERDAAIARFKARETIVLSNVALFTEGFNVPGVECVSIVRPTQSLSLHRQMIGRATRIHAGKRHPIVLDHAGNMLRHGRITRQIDYTLGSGVQPSGSVASGIRTCPKCYRLCASGRARCLECGYVFGSEAERELPQTIAGELEAYQDPETGKRLQFPAAERASYFAALQAEAEQRGWKPGAVAYRFKEKFGVWPVIVEADGGRHLAHEESPPSVRVAALAQWLSKAQERGWKPGYAGARFKELFGGWPSKAERFEAQAIVERQVGHSVAGGTAAEVAA